MIKFSLCFLYIFQRLTNLLDEAERKGDAHLSEFVQSELMAESNASIQRLSVLMTRFRRVAGGSGAGLDMFDMGLQ